MNTLKRFGFKNGLHVFFLFGLYGLLFNIYIGLKHGFSSSIPDESFTAATEPVSVFTFSLFMLSAFVFVAITTRFGKKHRDISDKQSYLVRFTVRIVEFTFEIGCSIIGTLVGLAVSAYMLHFLGAVTVSQHSILFAFAVVVFAILYAFMLLTISMFEHANRYQFVLNIASIIYIAFVLSLFFYFELYLAIAYFGSAMTLFLIVRQVRKCISHTQQ